VIFNYLKMLRETSIPQAIFQEFQRAAFCQFTLAERMDEISYVMDLSSRLQLPIPREKLISSKWLVEEIDIQAFGELVQNLTFENCILTLLQRGPANSSTDAVQKEPIFGTSFIVSKILEATVNKVCPLPATVFLCKTLMRHAMS
jgi:insulysin